ncbi:MAG: autotransporter domain-containing protein [Azospirillaceae bacterium]|nr:autotransporter domain-containing protein [Azospirillaceae bacterium]
MSKITRKRGANVLLISASVLALAASWQQAKAETAVTGASGPITITSGNLSNSGTISGPSVAIDASGNLGTVINAGLVVNTTSTLGYLSGTAVSLHYDTLAGTPASVTTLRNDAGATIKGGFTGVKLVGATIGTLANSGLITTFNSYQSGGITGAIATLSGLTLASAIGLLTNATDATISGYSGINLAGGSIGTLVNSGLIQGNGGYGVNVGVGTLTTYAPPFAPGTLGTLVNNAGATISGGVNLVGASVGTIVNNGVISGAINVGSYFNYDLSGSVQSFVSIVPTLGTLINGVGATIAGLLLNGTTQTIDNAGVIGGQPNYLGISASGTIISLTNEATGTITGGSRGFVLSGAIGTLHNSGMILSTGSGYGPAVSIAGSVYYDTTLAAYQGSPSNVGTFTNDAGATISGQYGGVVLDTVNIETLTNNGVIKATSGAGFSLLAGNTSAGDFGGTMGALLNGAGATISGGYTGVLVYGSTIGTLVNSGLIKAGDAYASGISINAGTGVTTAYTPGLIASLDNAQGATIAGSVAIAINGGTIGSLQNDGLIVATGSSAGISIAASYGSSQGVINTLVNGVTGTISGQTGILLASGTLSTLVNNGLITGSLSAIEGENYNPYGGTLTPSIGQIINAGTLSATGLATLTNYGTAVRLNDVDVGTITNSGLITGAEALYVESWSVGTSVAGTVGLIDNLAGASIVGTGAAAVDIDGTVDTLRNNGLITDESTTSTLASAIAVSGALGTLLNLTSGTISGPGSAVAIGGTVGILSNDGVLEGGLAAVRVGSSTISSSTTYGAYSYAAAGSIGTLSNSGTLTGGVHGIQSSGEIDVLSNSGTISGDTGAGIANIGSVVGHTSSISSPWEISTQTSTTGGGTVGTLNNSGVISGGQDGILNGAASVDNTTVTSQAFYWSGYAYSITTVVGTTGPIGGTIGTLINAGTILGVAGAGIDNGASNAVIGTLVNSGLIQGGQTGIINAGTIGALTNSGTITGAVAAIRNTDTGALPAIVNTGVIAGDIINTSAHDLAVTGGTGTVFGTLTGVGGSQGNLVNTASNVSISGNVVLNDTVNVAGHTLVNSGGDLVVNGAVSITGNYSQSSGTLAVLASAGTSSGLVVSGTASISNSTVLLTGGSDYSLVSNSSYTLVSAGDATSSYSGLTVLATGYTTNVTTAVVDGMTDLIVRIGGSSLSAGGTATISSGAGVLDQMTGGELSVTGGTPTVGTISGGTVTLTGGSATLGTISGGTIVQGTGSTIAGSQAIQVIGGTLNLGGTITAPLAVNGGLTAINGVAGGDITVGSGGTLRGTGLVTGSATVSGILAPGNSPGTLTFTKTLTQGAGSTLSIDIDGTGTGAGAGNYSRVLVTGGSYVIGSGATLQAKLRGITGNASNTYTPSLGTDFTVVQAAGGVSGSFASITQPAAGLLAGTQFSAVYTSNAVDLYVTPTFAKLTGASANQQAVGRVVSGLNGSGNSDLGTVLKALYSAPTMGASLDALSQIGGSSQANIVAYSLTRGLQATQVLGQRLAAVRDGMSGSMQGTMQAELVGRTLYTAVSNGDGGAPVQQERGASAGSALPEDGWHFWAQGLGAFNRVDSDGNAGGGHSNTGGGLFGGDRAMAPGVTVGLAGSLLQSTSGGSNETASYGLSAYGNVDLGDGLFVTGNAGYTYDQYDTSRTMSFGGLTRTAVGSASGGEVNAGVSAGYRVRVSNLTLEPQAGLQWLRVSRDGFTETGAGALNLAVDELDTTALQSSVGGRASANWTTEGGTVITPTVRAAWVHDFRDRALTSEASLLGSGFAVTGPETGRDGLAIGGGLTLQEGRNLNLYANYDGTLRRGETDHVFTAGFRLSW